MERALEPATLAAMRAIKQVFDPDGILNPGKLLP
jgi:D-lactate dehydrogenase